MKLSPDACRDMLLKIEKEHTSPGWEWPIGNDDYEQFYIASKLREAGMILAEDVPGAEPDSEFIFIQELTYSGHEFLEGIRDPKAWKTVKKSAAAVGNFSVAVLSDLAKAYVRTQLQKHGMSI